MTYISLPTKFGDAARLIDEAKAPKDIFGEIAKCEGKKLDDAIERVTRIFRRLAVLVHPDRNPKETRKAELAIGKLGDMRDEAEALCRGGDATKLNGNANAAANTFTLITFKTAKNTYTITGRKADGGTKGIFEGIVSDKKGNAAPVIMAVPHSADDNDLMEREARALLIIRKKARSIGDDAEGKTLAEKLLMRMPALLESIKLEEPGVKKRKVVNTFAIEPGWNTGWFTLEDIRRAYPAGVSTRIMCFIWNRLFEGMTAAHAAGIVHCAITPNHVLIHAKSHAGNLLDWTASCRIKEGDKVPYIDEARYPGYFPEEILVADGKPSPATDIYMSAWCMVYALGGDPKARVIPETVEKPIRDLLNKCLQPKRRMRPQTADAAYQEFQQIVKGLYGPRKFVDLIMPTA